MIEINWFLLAAQVATFLAAMVLVWKLSWGPLTQFMRERSERIAADLKRAEEGRKEIDALEAEYRRRLAEVEERAQQEIKEALAKGRQEKEGLVEEARQEARQILEKAQSDLELERERVLQSLHAQVTELSLAALERVLGQGLDRQIQQRLLDKFLHEVEQVEPKT